MTNSPYHLEHNRLCAKCIGETYLRAEVQKEGTQAVCDYCEVFGRTKSLNELADRIEGVFDEHYRRTPIDPDPMQLLAMQEDGHGFYRDGDPTAYAIADLAQIPEAAAAHLQILLAARHSDIERDQMGEESEFAEEAHYETTRADLYDHSADWRRFERSVQQEARYFSPFADEVLGGLFRGLERMRTHSNRPVIRKIGPGTRLTRLHRGRVFQSDAKLEEALADPEQFIGTPASQQAANGRMNARGVPVFYGATAVGVVLAEVRPPIGSRVVTAEFEILRPLRVLDVAALEAVLVKGSLFDPDFGRQFNRAAFLKVLSRRITLPVMPDDEATEYLVTQVMAEFLANRLDPPVDGILYSSAQGVGRQSNVVLFNKAARVERLETRPDDKVRVSLSIGWSEEEEPHYSVWRTRAPRPAVKQDPFGPLSWRPVVDDGDYRLDTLRLDRATLVVRHIEAVRVKTEDYAVQQYETASVVRPPSLALDRFDIEGF